MIRPLLINKSLNHDGSIKEDGPLKEVKDMKDLLNRIPVYDESLLTTNKCNIDIYFHLYSTFISFKYKKLITIN